VSNNGDPRPNVNNIPKSVVTIYWQFLAVIVVTVAFTTAFQWVADHPFAGHMDEAVYLNQVQSDAMALDERGIKGLARSILYQDRAKPPAYRLTVLPVTSVWDNFSLTTLRIISLVFILFSLVFVYLTATQLAGAINGAFSVIFLTLCPLILSVNKYYGTELPLIFAIAAMFYFLFSTWDREDNHWLKWVGLGVALGIGAWSKLTFVFVAGPVILVAFVLSLRRVIIGPSPVFLLKASLLGIVLAAPWWILNLKSMLDYALYAGAGFTRHALSPSLWEKLTGMPVLYAHQALGPTLALFVVVISIVLVTRYFLVANAKFSNKHRGALWVCLAGILPIIMLQIIGNNQNVRFVIVSLIPFALAVGIVVSINQWLRKPVVIGVLTVMFGFQLFQIAMSPQLDSKEAQRIAEERGFFGAGPAEVFVYADHAQWNWGPLRDIAISHNITSPSIAHLGNGSSFSSHHMKVAWGRQGEGISAKWLWRHENGEIDWAKIENDLLNVNIVLTAPGYKGNPLDKQELDNQHNTEFAERLRLDKRFMAPITLKMGITKPVEILVFVRKL